MTMRKGQPLKLGATDADDTRYDYKNHVVTNSDGTPRGGVTGPVGTAIVTSSATMNVSVAAFSAAAVRDGGVVLLANDGPTNVLLTSAPASNSRIDVIYAKQNDASATVTTPDANNTPVLDKATGTASATPAKPSIPTGAVELATVLIPSTATSTNSAGVVITQTAPFTAAPGASVPFRKAADLTWTTASAGQSAIVVADTVPLSGEYVWNGSAWKQVSGLGRIAFAPTWSNFNPSTSAVVASYGIVSGFVIGQLKITLASGWNITGDISFAPPVTPAFTSDGMYVGGASYLRVGLGNFVGGLIVNSSGRIRLVAPGGSSPSQYWSSISNTVPAGFDNGDIWTMNFAYAI